MKGYMGTHRQRFERAGRGGMTGSIMGGTTRAGMRSARRAGDLNTAVRTMTGTYRAGRKAGVSVMGSMTSAFRDVWQWTGAPMRGAQARFAGGGKGGMGAYLKTPTGAQFAQDVGPIATPSLTQTASFREKAFESARGAGRFKGAQRAVRGRRAAAIAVGAVAVGGMSFAGGGLFATAGAIAAGSGVSSYLRGGGRGRFISGALGLAAGVGANYMLGGRAATMMSPSPAMSRGPYTF